MENKLPYFVPLKIQKYSLPKIDSDGMNDCHQQVKPSWKVLTAHTMKVDWEVRIPSSVQNGFWEKEEKMDWGFHCD
jgi:hypothetical protein